MAKSMKSWVGRLLGKWAVRRQRKLRQQLERDSRAALQLMEFGGEMYISCDGTPVVRASDLKTPAVDVLRFSRKAWIEFRLGEMENPFEEYVTQQKL